jgi:ribosome recycling factor
VLYPINNNVCKIMFSIGSIETIKVKFEGSDHALNELAQVARKNPKTLIVNCSSVPQAIPNILQAIKQSGMNLSPQQDGTTLFIPIPVWVAL